MLLVLRISILGPEYRNILQLHVTHLGWQHSCALQHILCRLSMFSFWIRKPKNCVRTTIDQHQLMLTVLCQPKHYKLWPFGPNCGVSFRQIEAMAKQDKPHHKSKCEGRKSKNNGGSRHTDKKNTYSISKEPSEMKIRSRPLSMIGKGES